MAGLPWVGKPELVDEEIQNHAQVAKQITPGTINRSYVNNRVNQLAAQRATAAYVVEKDKAFVDAAYPAQRDELLIPKDDVGEPGGVASLDGTGRLPLGQAPNVGIGVLRGRFGITNEYAGTTSRSVPLKIADWQIGVLTIPCQVMAYMSVLVQTQGNGRPVVEIRAGTPTNTDYASQTLVAFGVGRNVYNDYQPVTVLPSRPGSGGKPTSYSAAMNLVLTAWLINDGTWAGATHKLDINGIVAASAWLLRSGL